MKASIITLISGYSKCQEATDIAEENLQIVRTFFDKTSLINNSSGIKAVIEFRDPSWWTIIDRIEEIGIVFCSVDAPNLPRTISVTDNSVYLLIHEYKEWYRYIYSEAELDVLLISEELKCGEKSYIPK